MKRTKIFPIEPTKSYSLEQENDLKKKMGAYCDKTGAYAVSTQTIGFPFRAIYINSPDSKLLLMNPRFKNLGTDFVNSTEVSEFDDNNKKARIVRRYLRVEIECDNLGVVLFEGNTTENTAGLNECIMAQQMMDLLNGITIRDKNINLPIVKKVKYERNQLILARSPKGMIEQVKYKHVEALMDKGYTIL